MEMESAVRNMSHSRGYMTHEKIVDEIGEKKNAAFDTNLYYTETVRKTRRAPRKIIYFTGADLINVYLIDIHIYLFQIDIYLNPINIYSN